MSQQATKPAHDTVVQDTVADVAPDDPQPETDPYDSNTEPEHHDLHNQESVLTTVIQRGRGVAESAVPLKKLMAWTVVIAMIAGLGVLSWELRAKIDDVDQMTARAANYEHAEQVALDYAVAAAEMDFRDLGAWHTRLTKGTSPELSNKLSAAATSMNQIITPLQWVSTSTPITAKVITVSNGIYSIDCFVNVITKNSQAPDGIHSTATYRLAIDSTHNWVITDVSGIDSAVPSK
jgi:Mce-associated membrane protein